MSHSIHEALIRACIPTTAKRVKFKKELTKALKAQDFDQETIDTEFGLRRFSRVPDAFEIFPDSDGGGLIKVYEVEWTGSLNDNERMEDWIELWFCLDCMSWQMEMYAISRHGNIVPVRLATMWHGKLALDVERSHQTKGQ